MFWICFLFAQHISTSTIEKLKKKQKFKRFEIDCIDNVLFIFDENGKQLLNTDVSFCRMTFLGIVTNLRSEHQR